MYATNSAYCSIYIKMLTEYAVLYAVANCIEPVMYCTIYP